MIAPLGRWCVLVAPVLTSCISYKCADFSRFVIDARYKLCKNIFAACDLTRVMMFVYSKSNKSMTTGAGRCVRKWLISPIRAWKPLTQVAHQWVGGTSIVFSARAFWVVRFSFSALDRFATECSAPLWIRLCQVNLSDAAFSQVVTSILKSLR